MFFFYFCSKCRFSLGFETNWDEMPLPTTASLATCSFSSLTLVQRQSPVLNSRNKRFCIRGKEMLQPRRSHIERRWILTLDCRVPEGNGKPGWNNLTMRCEQQSLCRGLWSCLNLLEISQNGNIHDLFSVLGCLQSRGALRYIVILVKALFTQNAEHLATRCVQIIRHIVVNGSVHTLKATSKGLHANLYANLLARPVWTRPKAKRLLHLVTFFPHLLTGAALFCGFVRCHLFLQVLFDLEGSDAVERKIKSAMERESKRERERERKSERKIEQPSRFWHQHSLPLNENRK